MEQLLINGNWNQTIAYLLEQLQILTTSGVTNTDVIIQLLGELEALAQSGATADQTIIDILGDIDTAIEECCLSGQTADQIIIDLINSLSLQVSGCTQENSTTVIITDLISLPPKQITVVDYTFSPHPTPKIIVNHQYIRPEPIIRHITIKDAYLLNCGSWNPNDSKYRKCMQCVDKFIVNNPDVRPVPTNGVKCKPTKSNCQKNVDACIQNKRRRMR